MSEKLFKVWFGEVRPVEYTIIAKDKKVAMGRAKEIYIKDLQPSIQGIMEVK